MPGIMHALLLIVHRFFKATIFMVIATFIKIPLSPSNKCLVGFGPKGLKSIERSTPRRTVKKSPSLGVDGSNPF